MVRTGRARKSTHSKSQGTKAARRKIADRKMEQDPEQEWEIKVIFIFQICRFLSRNFRHILVQVLPPRVRHISTVDRCDYLTVGKI